jgi:predicted nucleic acid-binding protein
MAELTGNYARKVKEQDFHDDEHAIVPAVYADVFVTGDRHLLDLLTRRCDIPAARGCKIVRGVQGLREVLRSLTGSEM